MTLATQQQPQDSGRFSEQFLETIERDSFRAGFMHGTAGREMDLTEHMFGTRRAYDAYNDGCAAGLTTRRARGIRSNFSNDAMLMFEDMAWHQWRDGK